MPGRQRHDVGPAISGSRGGGRPSCSTSRMRFAGRLAATLAAVGFGVAPVRQSQWLPSHGRRSRSSRRTCCASTSRTRRTTSSSSAGWTRNRRLASTGAMEVGRRPVGAQDGATSLAHPDWCSIAVVHEYDLACTQSPRGQRSSASSSRSRRLCRWLPPAGFTPAGGGLAPLPSGHLLPVPGDRVVQPPRNMPLAIWQRTRRSSAMLSGGTGLTFTETLDPQARPSRASVRRHRRVPGSGRCRPARRLRTCSNSNWWPTDPWPGFGIVRQPSTSSAAGSRCTRSCTPSASATSTRLHVGDEPGWRRDCLQSRRPRRTAHHVSEQPLPGRLGPRVVGANPVIHAVGVTPASSRAPHGAGWSNSSEKCMAMWSITVEDGLFAGVVSETISGASSMSNP